MTGSHRRGNPVAEDQITFVNTIVVPWGLIAIMLSLGLSLSPQSFASLLQRPRAVFVGLTGQILLMPLLGLLVATVFRLQPEMAVGLLILASSPAGVTSNAVVFAARGNVALSVALTALSSLITVVSSPLVVSLALRHYYVAGTAPLFSIEHAIAALFKMTVLPVAVGMVVRHIRGDLASKLVVLMRPLSLLVLIFVIGFSLFVSAGLVWRSIAGAGPAVWTLNVIAMAIGIILAKIVRLDLPDAMTIGIEVGVHNATVATFVTLSVLHSLELSIVPTIYGIVMILNAFVLVNICRADKFRAWLVDVR
jgi:BASS family bile acid:Na+ symporter